MENPALATTSSAVTAGRPREWEEVLRKISQPPSPPPSAPSNRSPHGKNRTKVKPQNTAPPSGPSVDLSWALDLLEPLQLPNPQIQKEEAGTMLYGLCHLRQVFLHFNHCNC